MTTAIQAKATLWTENEPEHGIPVLCIRAPYNVQFTAHLKEALPRSTRWFTNDRKLWMVEIAYRRDAEDIVRQHYREVVIVTGGDPNLNALNDQLQAQLDRLQARQAKPANATIAQLQAQNERLRHDLADERASRERLQRELQQQQQQRRAIPGNSPLEILALALKPESLKRFYHLAAHDAHPDQGGSTAAMQAVNLAWEQLKRDRKL